ncbi:MAG TPA: FAD:protein FMN transferase [Verrucomicrobiae bacterium]|nr:FAD:protein FMN transferase [Verrucomicrobiae bacterium]
MSDGVHIFRHEAMATHFEVRISGEEKSYAGQAARTAFDLLDRLEGLLSRFRENSEISQIGFLTPGEELRLSEPTFACLEIARRMEAVTHSAFCVSPDAVRRQLEIPVWSLNRSTFSIHCESGRLQFDLGAIGKGFALDRMAEELADWGCPSFLLVAGGSSILAGNPPSGMPGWSCGLGESETDLRLLLQHCSLSGSGLAVKGAHILDPRIGKPVTDRGRAWALTSSAAESDALSTAAMVLTEDELFACMDGKSEWLVLWNDSGVWREAGARPRPPADLV